MQKKREGILIVDDEAVVLQAAQRLLEKKGFSVFVAISGPHALSVLKENYEAIGVILLDISMPGMDGEETLENILKIDPEAKVLLFSGYAKCQELDPLFEKGAVGHIQKPFEINELLAKLMELLKKS
jgi:CheY-like chemotaxis protein